MKRKWLFAFAFSVCTLILGLTLVHAQSQPQSTPPTERGQSVSGDEPFFIQFDSPVPPPDGAAGDVFFYSTAPGAPIGVGAGPEFDIAFAGPVTAPLPFPPPDPQGGPPAGISFVGPDPQNNITFVNFQAGLGNKTVSGAPYCAQITSEFTQTLQDGNKIDRKNATNVCRDGQGRTWRQGGLPAIGQFSPSNAPQFIFIDDPVAGVNYVLDPGKKTARKTVRPNFQGGPGRGPGRGPGGPPPNNASPNGPQRGGNNNNVSNQSLGQQNIEGILVNGTLVTRTIPAGRVGNQSPIQVTSERWNSPDLQIDLLVKNNDPEHGQNTTTVSNINRSEPDSSIFQVPADYTVQDTNRGRGGLRGGPKPPPPPPQQ